MIGTFRWSAAAMLVLAMIPAVASAAPSTESADDPDLVAQIQEVGVFAEHCRFSHQAPDDPIVFPGQAGASHMHLFFGNTTTNADSTLESLRAGGTTCRTAQDRSGYWVPSLMQNGAEVRPRGITVYYRAGRPGDQTTVQAFPPGFRMVAGDARATAPQANLVTFWNCQGNVTGISLTPVACPPGTNLNLHVRFPPCWDGVNLDSADHKSHLAYPVRGSCPASHPVRVPALAAIVHFPAIADPGSLALSSGGVYSGHADFFNAWDQSALQEKIDSCLNAHVNCNKLQRPANLER